MNNNESLIISLLLEKKIYTQRELSIATGYSLGNINKHVKNLIQKKYISKNMIPTAMAKKEFMKKKTKNAIILAAGYGMRMVPINVETPKGLLEVNGEVLIERTIKQLKEAGVNDIFVIVGFMKEKYEYLIDEFGVKLIVNNEYSTKNNLYSLNCALNHLDNTYIIPCDIWCKQNFFRMYEPYSWYMINSNKNYESNVKINKKNELILTSKKEPGNTMIGISYIEKNEANIIKKKIKELVKDKKYDNAFWEETLIYKNKFITNAKMVDNTEAIEINTYEQLRNLDNNSNQLKNSAIKIICDCLNVTELDINNITVLKKGMTNRSFLFNINDKKYIMRIPGEGTSMLINRNEEAEVYQAIKGKKICDNIVYINPKNGYKITEFIENSRVCNPKNNEDLKKCMKFLREFHSKKLKVSHEFNIFEQINFYESLWNGEKSIYKDYEQTKKNVLKLRKLIDNIPKEYTLTHIDAIPDNFLIYNKDGKEQIRLIDWEYSGMQDPHVDIAMFCIYSLYDKNEVDNLISIYFENKVKEEEKIKIYAYIAVCGLLWSNWCEYKRHLGIEFGEYSIKQYRYAKEYFKLVEKQKGGNYE